MTAVMTVLLLVIKDTTGEESSTKPAVEPSMPVKFPSFSDYLTSYYAPPTCSPSLLLGSTPYISNPNPFVVCRNLCGR